MHKLLSVEQWKNSLVHVDLLCIVDLYQKLFSIHKISREQFRNSLHYYEKRPDLLKPIFDSLQKRSERQTIRTKPV